MTDEPVELATALASFEALWSPRIVAQVNDYDVRIAKVAGEHVWHRHENTDEFFLVLAGELRIALRGESPGGDVVGAAQGLVVAAEDAPAGSAAPPERVVVLPQGAVFVVPRGIEHKPTSVAGASILMFEPTGTSTVGDRHDPVPGHVDATTGHPLRPR